MTRRRAVVLLVVLWSVAFLAIVVAAFATMARTHLMIVSNTAEGSQLRLMASAGVERAIAEIGNDTAAPDTLQEPWAVGEETFAAMPVDEGTVLLRRWSHLLEFEQPEPAYGIEDEASKLNLRTADREALRKLKGLDEAQISAILDWQDEDGDPSQPDGAESAYYLSLREPHPAKNAPLDTVAELLRLRGIGPEVLYGEDWNRNGVLDPNENDGDDTAPPDNQDGLLDPGLLPFVTVWATDKNVTRDGADRVNLNSASETELKAAIGGLTDDEAKAIVSHRGSAGNFESVGALLDVRQPAEGQQGQQQGAQQQQGQQQGGQQGNNRSQRGRRGRRGRQNQEAQQPPQNAQQQNNEERPKVFTTERVKAIVDYVTVNDNDTVGGRININTAPARVLATLPQVDEALARQIVQSREQEGRVFNSIGDLLDVPGVTPEIFTAVAEKITTRSWQFRVESTAQIEGIRTRRTIVAVLDRSGGASATSTAMTTDATGAMASPATGTTTTSSAPIRILYWNEP